MKSMVRGRGLAVTVVTTLVSLFLLVLFAATAFTTTTALPLRSSARQQQQRSRAGIPSETGNDRLSFGAARQRSILYIHHQRLGFLPRNKALSDFFNSDNKAGWQVNAQESEQNDNMDMDDSNEMTGTVSEEKQTGEKPTTTQGKRKSMGATLRSVWVQLSTGSDVVGQPTKVEVSEDATIAYLRNAVKLVDPNSLRDVNSDRLEVFPPNTDSADSSNALRPDALVPSGTTDRLPLTVQHVKFALQQSKKKLALERANDFVSSIIKDPDPIEGSDGMSVLRDVVDLETGDRRDVVIRNCTEKFWNSCIEISEIPSMRYGVGAIGTPGTGKTASTAILIRMLLQKGHTVVYLVRTKLEKGWYYEFTRSTTSVFREYDLGEDITSLRKQSTYFVVDPGHTNDDCVPECTFQARVILVSSPDERHWGESQFIKLRGNTCGHFKYFPLWSLEELLQARPILNLALNRALTIDEVKKRYRQVGGVPRHVYSDDEVYRRAIAIQNGKINALTKWQALKIASEEMDAVESTAEDEWKSPVIGIRLANDDNGSFETTEVIVISDLVAEKICTDFIESLWSKMLDGYINGPMIFEAYGRLLMTKEATSFLCRPCGGKKDGKYKVHPTKLLGGCTEIRLVSDLFEAVAAAKAETGSKILFSPANKSYPLIDFLYKDEEQHFHAFQVTIEKSHDTKVRDIKELEDAIGDASKLSIYYAVPSENFPTFVTDPGEPKRQGALSNVFHVMIPNPNDEDDGGLE
jgi:hypothetical protein